MKALLQALLIEAGADPSSSVRAAALRGMFGNVERSSVRAEHTDRAIDVVKALPLPAEGWKLEFDPKGMGHGLEWFREEFDDSEWEETRIETAWQPGYVGVGWYRIRFALPEKPDCDGVELHFEGVDESTWLWVNGEYAGEHDFGPSGWDVPFSIDITDLVRWGEPNQVTVRVMNTAHAGGIWMPVTIHFLKVR